MKKLPVYLILFFSAVIIFSSCASLPGVSVEKRNFRSGYYFDIITGKTNKSEPIKSEFNEEPSDLPVKLIPVDNLIDPPPLLAGEEKKMAAAAVERKDKMKEKTIRKRFSAVAQKTTHSAKAFFKENALTAPGFNNSTASVENGGGIIWTLVGILVLVWLLSLLTGGWGLGGLIYILLVVALLLAIFRLLEVL